MSANQTNQFVVTEDDDVTGVLDRAKAAAVQIVCKHLAPDDPLGIAHFPPHHAIVTSGLRAKKLALPKVGGDGTNLALSW